MRQKSKEVVRKVIDKQLVTSFPTRSPLPQVQQVFEPGVEAVWGQNRARILQASEALRRRWVNVFWPGVMCRDPNVWHAVQYVSQHSFQIAFPAALRWVLHANRQWVEPFFETHLDFGNIRQQWKLDYYLDMDEEQGRAVARVLLYAKTFHRSEAAAKALQSHWSRYLKGQEQMRPWWAPPAPPVFQPETAAVPDAIDVQARTVAHEAPAAGVAAPGRRATKTARKRSAKAARATRLPWDGPGI